MFMGREKKTSDDEIELVDVETVVTITSSANTYIDDITTEISEKIGANWNRQTKQKTNKHGSDFGRGEEMAKPLHITAFEHFKTKNPNHLEAMIAFGIFTDREQKWALIGTNAALRPTQSR
jgi:hypothetical protein